MAWEIIKDTSTTKIFLVFITNPENLALKSTALFTRRIRRVGYWGGGAGNMDSAYPRCHVSSKMVS